MQNNHLIQEIDINALPVAIARIGFDGERFNLIFANMRFYKTLGLENGAPLPEPPYFCEVFPDSSDDSLDRFKKDVKTQDEITYPFTVVDKKGDKRTLEVVISVSERNGAECILHVCLRDISEFLTELSKKEQEYDRMINYDVLTGLPKNKLFSQICRDVIAKADPSDKYASVFLDINNFKLINEKIGKKNGNTFLLDLFRHLKILCEGRGYIMRAYSDRYLIFIKLIEGRNFEDEIIDFIENFTKEKHDQYPECNVTMGAGICYLGDLDFSVSVDYAAIAHKNAKITHENNCVVFDENMGNELRDAMNITNEAQHALLKNEFVIYYQPKVSLKTNKVVGAEALVRWKKDDGSIISPAMFIPYLEKTSFITKVDFYVYEEVCRLLRRYMDTGIELIPVSVNFSRLHLSDKEFVEKVIEMAERYGIPNRYIDLELTESASLEDEKVALHTFSELRKRGFLVSIDDFGSGYSSLNLLKVLPADNLKMDKDFFGDNTLKDGGNNSIMVSSIIEMADKMNIGIVCEGVETLEQVNFLRKTECNSIQGYYFAKPMPLEEFEAFREDFDSGRFTFR